jgi:hypothetical protein
MQKGNAADSTDHVDKAKEELSAQATKVRAQRRWKRAISMIVIGIRLQGHQGLLKQAKHKGPSLMDRVKQLERDLGRLVIQDNDKVPSFGVGIYLFKIKT